MHVWGKNVAESDMEAALQCFVYRHAHGGMLLFRVLHAVRT